MYKLYTLIEPFDDHLDEFVDSEQTEDEAKRTLLVSFHVKDEELNKVIRNKALNMKLVGQNGKTKQVKRWEQGKLSDIKPELDSMIDEDLNRAKRTIEHERRQQQIAVYNPYDIVSYNLKRSNNKLEKKSNQQKSYIELLKKKISDLVK